MTELQLAEAERNAIIARAGGIHKLKKRRPTTSTVSARALREAGLSERDIEILIEGHAHEVRHVREVTEAMGLRRPEVPQSIADALDVLTEAVDSTATSSSSTMSAPSGWTEHADKPGTFSHGTVPGTMHLTGNKWVHRVGGVIRGSGATMGSLTEYLKRVKKGTGDTGDTGNSGAADANAEALDDVLRNARIAAGVETPRPNAATARLVEALRTAGRTTGGSTDLHSRLRAAVTR